MGVGELGKHVASAFEWLGKRNELRAALQKAQAERDELRAALQKAQAERDELRARLQGQQGKHERRQGNSQLWDKITSLATLATVIVAIVAIILSIASLKHQDSSAATQDQESRYSSLYQLYLDVDKEITSYPRLAPCFRDTNCPPTLTSEEKEQAYDIAIYIVDFYQYLYTQLNNLGYAPRSGLFVLRDNATQNDSESWITWSETILYGFKYSAVECQALADSSAAYGEDFVHAVAVLRVCPSLTDPSAP